LSAWIAGAGDTDCIEADITSREALAGALASVRERHRAHIASVIHLAAFFDMTGEPNPLYDKVNVEGTARLLAGVRSGNINDAAIDAQRGTCRRGGLRSIRSRSRAGSRGRCSCNLLFGERATPVSRVRRGAHAGNV